MNAPTLAPAPKPSGQRGIALVVALIFLIVVSIIGISAVKFTSTDVRSSLNEEFRVASFELAQSVIEATAAEASNMPVGSDLGETLCTPNLACGGPAVNLKNNAFDAELSEGAVGAMVTRIPPLLGPPPRGSLGGSSLNMFDAANFLLTGIHDETDNGQGKTTINQGLIILIPKFGN